MKEVTALPAHALLNRRDEAGNHSTRPAQRGPASAFATYGFGPLDLDSAGKKASQARPVTGEGAGVNLLSGPTTSWLTHLASQTG